METNPPKDEIQQQVEQIVSAGALGKSEAYPRLLRYLGEKAQTGKSVKEIEIAIDVFGRDETFDVTQDSLIRVYIHKLRQKLDNFYNTTDATYAERLVIPKGSYLLQLQRNQTQQESTPDSKWRPNKRIAAVVILSMAVALLGQLGLSYFLSQLQTSDAAIASPLWSPLSESNNQLLVVVGDQFIYSQVTEEFEQLREIRDFSIASPDDFQQRLNSDPDFALRYRDFG
ncbi:MAG: helix-turn-helix domain-containing protein, partial [Porticoccaceae bacterium]|nr:helix-turn-helix domain-containing protein [Porticoccaceae bacterium]